jgi:DNA-binding SARP family transcriptional activator
MAAVELRFLGEFQVLKDGRQLKLPPSRKTRALLAYLCLEHRRFSREQLCELLWEVPDDPRGALRWSLSKLRRLIDEEDRRRVIADRNYVEVDTRDLSIDVAELRGLAANGMEQAATETLEAAAGRHRGNFLEGLEFSDFHDFHAWCIAERERSVRDRSALLSELIERLESSPRKALPHARSLVSLAPYDEPARATLIRLLKSAGQAHEAREQAQLGLRMLAEAGVESTGALKAALASGPAPAPDAAQEPVAPAASLRSGSLQTDLVGRGEELSRLRQALERIGSSHQAAVVFVRGAPGMGKSRLLESIRAMAESKDAYLLRATAFEADAIRPFGLWADALRPLDGDRYESVFGAADIANRDRLFGALADLVAAEARERPVVIVFDDLHWSDESSAAALHYVARMNRNRPVLGVVASRDGELRDNPGLEKVLRGMRRDGLLTEITLGPLSKTDLREIIAREAPDINARRLSGECGGNPLLAIELARAEREGSAGVSLDELVRERLARFTTTGAEVLRWASILVPPFDIGTLDTLTQLDAAEIGAALETGEAQGMLVPAEGGLKFSHDLIGKAVYADLSPIRRQVMHRRVAESLVRNSENDLAKATWLAHHATLSGDPRLAARAMVAAGRLSLRFFANDDARSLARKGLQFAKQLAEAERVAVMIELHEVLLSAEPLEDWEAAAELYASLAERALDQGDLSHARLGYFMASYVRWTQGEWEGARQQSLQSARVVRSHDSKAQIVGMAEAAKCLVMLERDLSEADAMLMEAGALAQRKQFAHPAIAAGKGMLRFHENRLDEAEELFQESRTLCKSAGDRLNEFLASEYLVIISLQRGRPEEARERAQGLVALGEKIRQGSEEPFARALLGLSNYALEDDFGPLDTALADLRIADAKYRLAYIQTRAALIDCERGRKDEAVARSREALGYAELLERPTEMLLAHAVLACGYAGGDAADAAEHAQTVERLLPAAATWTSDIARRLAEKL